MSELPADLPKALFVEMPPDMPWAHVGSAGNYVMLGLDEGDHATVQVVVTVQQAQAYARAITEAIARLS